MLFQHLSDILFFVVEGHIRADRFEELDLFFAARRANHFEIGICELGKLNNKTEEMINRTSCLVRL